jgi:hypothetical protein
MHPTHLLIAGLLAAAQATGPQTGTSWIRNPDTDKMTGKTTIIYSIAPVSSEGTTHARQPLLFIMCENSRFKYIDYSVGDSLSSVEPGKTMIQYRIDDKKMRIEFWTDGGQHTYSKSANIKELLTANRLILRVSTFTGDVVTDEFRVAGLDTPTFHADCGK